ncbi:DNA replication protein DnaC [Paraburkholderia sp. GAS41]|jgi:DNA replication protein DnaC
MTPQLERLTGLCKQLNLLHLPTQIAHLGQMAAKRELGYLDFLEQALKDEAMARAERMRRIPDDSCRDPRRHRRQLPLQAVDGARTRAHRTSE